MTDYKKIFESLPALYVAILPDDPNFTVMAVTASYCRSVQRTEEELVGKPLFSSFADNPTVGESGKLFKTLQDLVKTKAYNPSTILRYDINGELKYWSSQNIPIIAPNGEIEYIIHAPIEITEFVKKGLKID